MVLVPLKLLDHWAGSFYYKYSESLCWAEGVFMTALKCLLQLYTPLPGSVLLLKMHVNI